MLQTICITVHGKVQGVYFRQSAKQLAKQLLITGTVANVSNGDVQIVATGTKEQLQSLISWCLKGPRGAKVESLETENLPLEEFMGFRVISENA